MGKFLPTTSVRIRGCPDTHRRYGCQDGVKRAGLHGGLDPSQDLRPGLIDTGQHARQFRQDDSCGAGSDNHDLLFIQGAEVLFGEPVERFTSSGSDR